MSYVDLSHQISADTPVYPGDPKVEIKSAGVLSNDGFADSILILGTHVGTHIDAPAHMIDGGATLDSYAIDRFISKAICIDVRDGFDALETHNLKDIFAIFFYTGTSARYTNKSYWKDYPVIPESALRYLLKSEIKTIGIDAGSVDNQQDFPIHKQLLLNDILIIENLTNLDQVTGKVFEYTALPLNVALDGAPCRVIAKV